MRYIILIFVFLITNTCSITRSTLDYGKSRSRTVTLLKEIPNDWILIKYPEFNVYASSNSIIRTLKDDNNYKVFRDRIKSIDSLLINQHLTLSKIEQDYILSDTIKLESFTTWDLEYSLDLQVKNGNVYIENGSGILSKIIYKSWMPKYQGAINSKWFTKDGQMINEVIHGFVD
jgi:hypothetical protein